MAGLTGTLFPDERTPEGFRYAPELVTRAEEAAWLAELAAMPLEEVRMRGQVARRRVAHLGLRYAYGSRAVAPSSPMPPSFEPLRERCAALAGVRADALAEALVTHYPVGAGIGWHFDAPAFGDVVVGVSLASACRMRFRRPSPTGFVTWEALLEPRSAYVIAGVARREWQHAIPRVEAERWSITFRTLAR